MSVVGQALNGTADELEATQQNADDGLDALMAECERDSATLLTGAHPMNTDWVDFLCIQPRSF